MNRDQEILIDIIRACNLIQEFCQDLDFLAFERDIKTQSSVLYQIVIIGEAINRLSLEFAQSNPQVPINAIRGMRNRAESELLRLRWFMNIKKLILKFYGK